MNNILTVLNVMLKKAVEWGRDRSRAVFSQAAAGAERCRKARGFYDFDEYERLVAAAKAIDQVADVIVLLEAGLRCGEMIALEWRDVDLGKRQLCVQRSDWNGQVTCRTIAIRPAHHPSSCSGITRPPAPAQPTGAVSGRWSVR